MGVTAQTLQNYQVRLTDGRHVWLADEALADGGDDLGPCPYDLLLASLCSCVVITLHTFTRRKGWPLERVHVAAQHERQRRDNGTGAEYVDVIEMDLRFEGPLTALQEEQLLRVAQRCPIHRLLSDQTVVQATLSGSQKPVSSAITT